MSEKKRIEPGYSVESLKNGIEAAKKNIATLKCTLTYLQEL